MAKEGASSGRNMESMLKWKQKKRRKTIMQKRRKSGHEEICVSLNGRRV